jgi:hypothetical protein
MSDLDAADRDAGDMRLLSQLFLRPAATLPESLDLHASPPPIARHCYILCNKAARGISDGAKMLGASLSPQRGHRGPASRVRIVVQHRGQRQRLGDSHDQTAALFIGSPSARRPRWRTVPCPEG